MAFWLTQAATIAHNLQQAEFWETLARALLAPMLYAAATTPDASMLDVVAWTNDYQLAEQVLLVLDTIEADNPTTPDPQLARSALLASLQAEQRRKDSIFGTAQVLLDVYNPGSAVRRHTGVVAALMLQVSAAGVVGSGPAGSEV